MQNLPVHWSEGMFLRPHHFQAADRYWHELVETSENWDHPYNYGLRSIEISSEALANYQVQVASCQARMKDGTLVALGVGQQLDRVDLKRAVEDQSAALVELRDAFGDETSIRVYLAVPTLKLGRPNVNAQSDADSARYIGASLSLQDESVGGNDQPIDFRTLNVRLLLSTQDLSGFEVLPIAQIKRAGDGEASPQLDEDYIPPLLAVEAWPVLSRDIVRAIYDIVGQRINTLTEQVRNRGMNLASQEAGDLENVLLLHVLNQANATLGCLTFAHGVHPLVVYTELCRIVGMLSIFGDERRVPEIPKYDHDDLARIFTWIKAKIQGLIEQVKQPIFEQRYFSGAGHGMEVSLETRWLSSDWDWYVGVNPGDLAIETCHELLKTGNWKLGSTSTVDYLFKNRAPGLELQRSPQAPRALPTGGGWIYYDVSRDNAAWQDVVSSQTLAMRFTENMIGNLESLKGQRTLEVVHGTKRFPLKFCLFAVRTY